jgi:hypothetical protein
MEFLIFRATPNLSFLQDSLQKGAAAAMSQCPMNPLRNFIGTVGNINNGGVLLLKQSFHHL